MSITDELRKEAQGHLWYLYTSEQAKHLLAIADRIDAEHEALRDQLDTSERQKESYREDLLAANRQVHASYNDGFASADDWLGQHEDAMREHGWVRLPKDADGEVVRIGDVMVMASHPFGCEDKPLVVDRMELSRGMHGEVWCLALDTDRCCWTQAAVLRHHHKPTVEDLLREFVSEFNRDDTELCDEEIIERFAAKLRLAESEES